MKLVINYYILMFHKIKFYNFLFLIVLPMILLAIAFLKFSSSSHIASCGAKVPVELLNISWQVGGLNILKCFALSLLFLIPTYLKEKKSNEIDTYEFGSKADEAIELFMRISFLLVCYYVVYQISLNGEAFQFRIAAGCIY